MFTDVTALLINQYSLHSAFIKFVTVFLPNTNYKTQSEIRRFKKPTYKLRTDLLEETPVERGARCILASHFLTSS